jgi:hypothetical protein
VPGLGVRLALAPDSRSCFFDGESSSDGKDFTAGRVPSVNQHDNNTCLWRPGEGAVLTMGLVLLCKGDERRDHEGSTYPL